MTLLTFRVYPSTSINPVKKSSHRHAQRQPTHGSSLLRCPSQKVLECVKLTLSVTYKTKWVKYSASNPEMPAPVFCLQESDKHSFDCMKLELQRVRTETESALPDLFTPTRSRLTQEWHSTNTCWWNEWGIWGASQHWQCAKVWQMIQRELYLPQ